MRISTEFCGVSSSCAPLGAVGGRVHVLLGPLRTGRDLPISHRLRARGPSEQNARRERDRADGGKQRPNYRSSSFHAARSRAMIFCTLTWLSLKPIVASSALILRLLAPSPFICRMRCNAFCSSGTGISLWSAS